MPGKASADSTIPRAIALHAATRHPQRVNRLVLMGSVGVPFPITEGLDVVWGYEPALESMSAIMDHFTYNKDLLTGELARVRFKASTAPGFQESYSAMFPAPRQRWVDAMVTPDESIAALRHQTLVVHGREDRVIPLANCYRLFDLIPAAQLHVFGHCGSLDPDRGVRRIQRHGAAFSGGRLTGSSDYPAQRGGIDSYRFGWSRRIVAGCVVEFPRPSLASDVV